MPRKTALDALERCRRDGAWSGQVLSSLLAKKQLDRRDSAFASRLFYGTLQNLSFLDHCIAVYCKGKIEPKVRDILRLGLYQILFMDKVPDSAAVNECVKLCKGSAFSRASGLVNAVLRRTVREGAPPVEGEGTASYLSILYSHPLWIVEELIGRRGYAQTEALLKANNRPVPVYIQTNTLKTSPEHLAAALGAERHPHLEACLILDDGAAGIASPEFEAGHFFVQDPAARMAVAMAEPKAGMKVLDACSAPGGKSFAAALEMKNEGEILSCDVSAAKLALVAEGAQRLGMSCIRVRPQDARNFHEPDAYDLVIADVPCSGMGVIRKKPDIRYRDREGIRGIPALQLEILNNLSQAVRPGGAIAYSTCTWRKEENEDLVRRFLSTDADFTIEKERTFWPDCDETDGFYICLMRRKKI